MKMKLIIIFFLIASFITIIFGFRKNLTKIFFTTRQSIIGTGIETKDNSALKENLEVVAQNLNIPWEITFLPNGDMLVTERSGRLLKIGQETRVIQEIEGVKHIGEGGLLGMTLHPNFSVNGFVYLYSTIQDENGLANRVERYKFSEDKLTERKVILEGIKGSPNHDGGRIAFGPDGFLYITTGDAEQSELAQDKNSLNGKILRIKDDGSLPPDNPFNNAVYSLGHRNPQGLAWDKNKNLWETEHGPSGIQTGYDEVNLISKGANYGWPIIKGDQTQEGLVSPIIQSGSQDTWAPSGLAFWNGSLFFAGLRGEALYEAKIGNDNKLSLKAHFKKEFGRLRTVVLGPDDYLYISTSNKDGRGNIKPGDDKIIKIKPKIFR